MGDLETQLMDLGCASQATRNLLSMFQQSAMSLAQEQEASFQRALEAIAPTPEALNDEDRTESYTSALQTGFTRRYIISITSMRQALLAEVSSARARFLATQSASAASTSAAQGTFTPSNLALLEQAFDLTTHISKAEKVELSRVTGLSERQLATWVSPSPPHSHPLCVVRGGLSAQPTRRCPPFPRSLSLSANLFSLDVLVREPSSAPLEACLDLIGPSLVSAGHALPLRPRARRPSAQAGIVLVPGPGQVHLGFVVRVIGF